jgi:hypothetical protein
MPAVSRRRATRRNRRGTGDDELLSFTAGLITAARRERGGEPRGDERVDADICWALATSLGVDVALRYRSPQAAARVLDHHIDHVPAARQREAGGPPAPPGPAPARR